MKNIAWISYLYSLIILVGCGSRGNTNAENPDPRPFWEQGKNNSDAVKTESGFRWIFKGQGDAKVGQDICDHLIKTPQEDLFAGSPNEAFKLEVQKGRNFLAGNPNATEYKNQDGTIVCKKEQIEVR